MATITFDSEKLADRLKTAGFTPEQAETVVRVIAEAQDELVTKKDLEIALAPLRADVQLLKWMMGFVLAGVVGILLKLFSI
ncbi:DUF1640 domain-containing protein [Polaromonas sp.]|mgnify:CR=1 FL=1|jgi:hypothetical protein|uniref:DUF1640 domain-containing protein n=1 Tax=Polaromonas sp. TaxID=1869339 RepID=UPI001DE3B402|nr:DUF1640 domain-containing protein [Polaromonas sp.]MBT9477481.1 DUF1640 domain-containing protein [Polaromonas sp.]